LDTPQHEKNEAFYKFFLTMLEVVRTLDGKELSQLSWISHIFFPVVMFGIK